MKTAPGVTVIRNGQLLPSTGARPTADAVVVVRDGRIAYAGSAAGAPPVTPEQTIDARGGTIMPGLVEAHFHPTYFNVAALEDLDVKYPVEYVTLLAAANARLALECGYTAARSGGSLFNIDVWLKKAIEADLTAGPRLAASGREICGVGGLMDWNPDYRKIGMEGLVLLVNGPVEARAAVRKLVKDGVEWVKTYPTGDAAAPDTNDHHTLCMTFEEMHAVVQTAHNHGLKVTGHCRATEGIKNALRAGYDALEHGTFMDDEALELLLQRDVPVVPALYFEMASVERGAGTGMSQKVIDGHKETLEGGAESARKILKAGGRLGMGGDYGFARRLREGADVLRQVRRLHSAGGHHLRDEDGGGDFGAAEGDRHAGSGEAGGRAGGGRRRVSRRFDTRRSVALRRRDAGRRREGGEADAAGGVKLPASASDTRQREAET
jgi:imidazolonepropionase-like amidohydrolase